MALQDDIQADHAAIAAAQQALDAANAKLAADQAALEALAPHLTAMEQFEAEMAQFGEEVSAKVKAFVAGAKARLGL
jgi:hypothetical protein